MCVVMHVRLCFDGKFRFFSVSNGFDIFVSTGVVLCRKESRIASFVRVGGDLRILIPCTSGFGSDQHRKSALCAPFRAHKESPPPTHTKTTFRPSSPTTLHHADFSHTSPTTLESMSAPFALQHGQKTLYPLLLSTIPSSVFLSMLSVTPTGLK